MAPRRPASRKRRMSWRTLTRVTDDLMTYTFCGNYTRWNAKSWKKKEQRAVKWNQKKNMMTKAETYSLNGWHPAFCRLKQYATNARRPTRNATRYQGGKNAHAKCRDS